MELSTLACEMSSPGEVTWSAKGVKNSKEEYINQRVNSLPTREKIITERPGMVEPDPLKIATHNIKKISKSFEQSYYLVNN
ncbi:hypothetical protein Glove_120g156 [Diversispora epigaea]|uniref:Uncharacterized protein n=1 Tax=Diversispora epigaea TaxID=1348612 RepID=A0A397J027_9GLOM|nr:hypothetical protein Glove_120g156 [Diversispora epigaea]